jgi:hypothetical protein
MKTPKEGDFAPEGSPECVSSLESLMVHIAALRQKEVQLIEHAQAQQLVTCQEALKAVLTDIPAHQEDLCLLEAIGKFQADSKRYVLVCFSEIQRVLVWTWLCHGMH